MTVPWTGLRWVALRDAHGNRVHDLSASTDPGTARRSAREHALRLNLPRRRVGVYRTPQNPGCTS